MLLICHAFSNLNALEMVAMRSGDMDGYHHRSCHGVQPL